MSLINKYLLNTYYLLGTVLITENFNKQKEWKDMFQEKWSKETESELKGHEEEEMSEKVTGGIGWFGKCYSTSYCTFQDWVQVSVPSSLTHKSKQFPKHKHSNIRLGTHPMQQYRFLNLFDDPRILC